MKPRAAHTKRLKDRKKGLRETSRRVFNVFLGLQFKSKWYEKSEIIGAVENAVKMAREELEGSKHRIDLNLEWGLVSGEPVNTQILSMVKNAAVAIFEVSEKNPNVYFEMGLACASFVSRPLLLFNEKAAKDVAIASDVKDILRLDYPNKRTDQVIAQITRHIKKEIREQIRKEAKSDAWNDLRKIWSGGLPTRQITIVCPELPKTYRPKYASKGSPEFVNLAHFGDLDALVEVLTLLPKLYPNAETKYVTSSEVHRNDKEGNLIVIGGPDFNALAKEFLDSQPVPFLYKQKGYDPIFFEVATKREFSMEKKKGRVTRDYGLFARFPNPVNKSNSVIMIGGLQTFGVLGAVQAFGMNTIGKKNAERIIERCTGPPRFAALIPVDISDGQPSISDIDISTLRPYPW